jgi:hypothetical protein
MPFAVPPPALWTFSPSARFRRCVSAMQPSLSVSCLSSLNPSPGLVFTACRRCLGQGSRSCFVLHHPLVCHPTDCVQHCSRVCTAFHLQDLQGWFGCTAYVLASVWALLRAWTTRYQKLTPVFVCGHLRIFDCPVPSIEPPHERHVAKHPPSRMGPHRLLHPHPAGVLRVHRHGHVDVRAAHEVRLTRNRCTCMPCPVSGTPTLLSMPASPPCFTCVAPDKPLYQLSAAPVILTCQGLPQPAVFLLDVLPNAAGYATTHLRAPICASMGGCVCERESSVLREGSPHCLFA